MSASTELSNGTNHEMKVLVGNGGYVSELATVEAGGKYVIGVDYNATYREYTVRVDAPGMENCVVSSDDLCDNKCITLKEQDRQLQVHMEPRQLLSTPPPTQNLPPMATKSEKSKHKWLRSWMRTSK